MAPVKPPPAGLHLRQDSSPPPSAEVCSGWNCLNQAQQFGVIFSTVFVTLTICFVYWHLVLKQRKGPTNAPPIVQVVDVELSSSSSSEVDIVVQPTWARKDKSPDQTATAVRFAKDVHRRPSVSRGRRSQRVHQPVVERGPSDSPPPKKRNKKPKSPPPEPDTQPHPITWFPITAATGSSWQLPRSAASQRVFVHQQTPGMTANYWSGIYWSGQLVGGQQSSAAGLQPATTTPQPLRPHMVYCYPAPQQYAHPYAHHHGVARQTPSPFPQQPGSVHVTHTVHTAQAMPIQPHHAAQPRQQQYQHPLQHPPQPSPAAQAPTSTSSQPVYQEVPPRPERHNPHVQIPVYREVPWWRRWMRREPTPGRASTISDSDSHSSRSRSPQRSPSPAPPNRSPSPIKRPSREKFGRKVDQPSAKRSPEREMEWSSTQLNRSPSPIKRHSREQFGRKVDQPSGKRSPERGRARSPTRLSRSRSPTKRNSRMKSSRKECQPSRKRSSERGRDRSRARLRRRSPSYDRHRPRSRSAGREPHTLRRLSKSPHRKQSSPRSPSPPSPVPDFSDLFALPSLPSHTTLNTWSPPNSAVGHNAGGGMSSPYGSTPPEPPIKDNVQGQGDQRRVYFENLPMVKPRITISSPTTTALSTGTEERVDIGPAAGGLHPQAVHGRGSPEPKVLYKIIDPPVDETSPASSDAIAPSSTGSNRGAVGRASREPKSAQTNKSSPRRQDRRRERRNQEQSNGGSDMSSFLPTPPIPFSTRNLVGSGDEGQSSQDERSSRRQSVADSMEVQLSSEPINFAAVTIPTHQDQGHKGRETSKSDFSRFKDSEDDVGRK